MGTVGPPTTVLALLIVSILYAAAYGLTLHDNVLIWGAAAFLQIPFLILGYLASLPFAILVIPLAFFAMIKYIGALDSFMGEEFLTYVVLGFVIAVMSGVV